MGDSLYNIEYSCISKFVLIQHILSSQVSDTGPMVFTFINVKQIHGLEINKVIKQNAYKGIILIISQKSSLPEY